MSEFKVDVVRIREVEKHPNADTLSICHIHSGYPVIFKTGDFHPGDLAVYIPVDALVPLEDSRFAFLKGRTRIRASKLRGIFSMGLLIPAEASWEEGEDVQELLKIKKYEPLEQINMGTENEHCPFVFPNYTDIAGLRRWPDILQDGEPVIITEKIHGTNAKYMWKDQRLWVGSHNTVKKEDSKNLWWRVAHDYNLTSKLQHYPDIVFYGEIYGWVQNLRYGHSQGKVSLVLFATLDLLGAGWHCNPSYIFDELELPRAPVLYFGPWNKELVKYAEGNTTVSGANHVREGFVVKPMIERFDDRIGRVILKYHGEGYL